MLPFKLETFRRPTFLQKAHTETSVSATPPSPEVVHPCWCWPPPCSSSCSPRSSCSLPAADCRCTTLLSPGLRLHAGCEVHLVVNQEQFWLLNITSLCKMLKRSLLLKARQKEEQGFSSKDILCFCLFVGVFSIAFNHDCKLHPKKIDEQQKHKII